MCVIACCVNRRLTKSEFKECFKSNNDGVGISWEEGGLNHYLKGMMDVEEAWGTYENIPGTKHVVHFRLASAGSVCEELTHPFACEEDDENDLTYHGSAPLLSHNGTVGGWKDLMLTYLIHRDRRVIGRVSDTRFVSMLVADMGEVALDLTSGKWALFDMGSIHIWGAFEEADGILFSNSSYKPFKYPKGYGGHWNKKDYNYPLIGS